MWRQLSLILLALVVQGSFPAKSTQTLRQRYGRTVSETFLVRPGIVVSARYGTSGDTCELVISSEEVDGMMKKWHGPDEIDHKLLKEIEDELVPKSERGKYRTGTFIDLACPPTYDCWGASEEWDNIAIYTNAGKTGARYGVIQWNSDECRCMKRRDVPAG
jgi:hypothetical protein